MSEPLQAPQATQTPPEGYGAVLRFIAWSLATTVGPLLPWLQGFLSYGLISEYHRDKLDPLVSVSAVAAFAIAYVGYRGRPRAGLNRAIRWWGGSVVACFFTCVLLMSTVGELFDPGPVFTELIRMGWIALYLFLFISVACFLCVLALLYAPTRGRAGRRGTGGGD